jgi:transposase
MYKLGDNIKTYSANDIVKAFHVSKQTAYTIIHSKEAHAKQLGRKLLVSEENLLNIFNNVKR